MGQKNLEDTHTHTDTHIIFSLAMKMWTMMMIFSDIVHYIVVLLRLLSLSEELATGC